MGARGTWLVVGVVATVVVAVVSLGEVGGSSARLSDSASTSDGPVVVTSGSASLTLGALALPTDPLYPGLTLNGPVTATNTGTVALTLGVAAATATSARADTRSVPALVLGLGTASSATDCRAGGAVPVWSGTASDPTPAVAAPTSVVLTAGQSRTLCVSVAMGDDGRSTSQGLGDLALALRLTGTQV